MLTRFVILAVLLLGTANCYNSSQLTNCLIDNCAYSLTTCVNEPECNSTLFCLANLPQENATEICQSANPTNPSWLIYDACYIQCMKQLAILEQDPISECQSDCYPLSLVCQGDPECMLGTQTIMDCEANFTCYGLAYNTFYSNGNFTQLEVCNHQCYFYYLEQDDETLNPQAQGEGEMIMIQGETILTEAIPQVARNLQANPLQDFMTWAQNPLGGTQGGMSGAVSAIDGAITTVTTWVNNSLSSIDPSLGGDLGSLGIQIEKGVQTATTDIQNMLQSFKTDIENIVKTDGPIVKQLMNEVTFEVMHNIPAELKFLHCAGQLAGALTGIGLKGAVWGIKIGGAIASVAGGRVLQNLNISNIGNEIGTFVLNAVNSTIENYPTELYYANIACEMGSAFASGFDETLPGRVLSQEINLDEKLVKKLLGA